MTKRIDSFLFGKIIHMLSNMMKDIDRSYWEYGAARNTGLPQSTVLELKKEIDSPDT